MADEAPGIPSLRDIAAAAGVSVATVSYALRNSPKISERRKAEIAAVAVRLGYRHNPMVQAWMRQRRTRGRGQTNETVAFVVPSDFRVTMPEHDYYFVYHSGAAKRAEALGYRLELFPLDQLGNSWRRLEEILHSRGIRGVVLGPFLGSAIGFSPERFAASSIEPVAEIPGIDFSSPDHYRGMAIAIANAEELGYRRLGYIAQSDDYEEHERWMAAFDHYCARTRICREDAVFLHRIEDPVCETALGKWFGEYLPDGILYINERIPGNLKSAGIRCPEDCGLVALERKARHESRAGVDQHLDEVAASAVEIVAHRLERNQLGLRRHPRCTFVQPEWVAGASLPARSPL